MGGEIEYEILLGIFILNRERENRTHQSGCGGMVLKNGGCEVIVVGIMNSLKKAKMKRIIYGSIASSHKLIFFNTCSFNQD